MSNLLKLQDIINLHFKLSKSINFSSNKKSNID